MGFLRSLPGGHGLLPDWPRRLAEVAAVGKDFGEMLMKWGIKGLGRREKGVDELLRALYRCLRRLDEGLREGFSGGEGGRKKPAVF